MNICKGAFILTQLNTGVIFRGYPMNHDIRLPVNFYFDPKIQKLHAQLGDHGQPVGAR
jgi:hypothetical protein